MKQRETPEKKEVKLANGVLDVPEGAAFNRGERVFVPASLVPRAVRRQTKFDQLVELLREDPRMPLTEMSRRCHIPVSTIFDMIRELRRYYKLELVLVRKPQPPEPKWKKQTPTSNRSQLHAVPELVGVCA